MYSEDAGQGFMRYDRNSEDENCQSFASRGDERYLRNRRGNRGSFTQKSWKDPSWGAAVEPNSLGETVTEVNNLRSIENTPLVSVSLSDQSQTQSLVKDKNNDNVHETAVKGQESEKENCLEPVEQKPWKWSRSLSSRSGCISHSTSSKSLGHESVEVRAEVQPKTAALERSLSVDVSCVRSKNAPSQSEGTGSRKKPRLGWGEGLAKYENKGVDGPEDGTTKSGLTRSGFSTESSLSQSINLLEKSPRVETLMECASPSTPSSGACRFSSGNVETHTFTVFCFFGADLPVCVSCPTLDDKIACRIVIVLCSLNYFRFLHLKCICFLACFIVSLNFGSYTCTIIAVLNCNSVPVGLVIIIVS